MNSRQPLDLGNRIYLIDGYDMGMPGRTGTYVILEDELTIVETGPSLSVPRIKQGFKDLGLNLSDLKYIIVTHIHLDHAGGAGLLLQDCPEATVVVHPRGARHLADPSRLIAGARAVYGERFDQWFDPIIPIPENRLLIKEDGDTLSIGDSCTLTFYDSPGHAAHHFSIYDPVSNGIFSGDTAGVRYHQTEEQGFVFYLPSTSPNQFDPEAMLDSIEKYRQLKLDRIYFGHFGMSEEVEEVYEQIKYWIPIFMEEGRMAFEKSEGTRGIYNRLLERVTDYLQQHDIPDGHEVYQILKLDMEVCAMGIDDYLKKEEKRKTSS
ncbi:MAG: MBL fold metallo-hydrolase [Bacillaceae bacterium]|nr:MBL fold metallo-hydrolase [Bacillaceae bacterium]